MSTFRRLLAIVGSVTITAGLATANPAQAIESPPVYRAQLTLACQPLSTGSQASLAVTPINAASKSVTANVLVTYRMRDGSLQSAAVKSQTVAARSRGVTVTAVKATNNRVYWQSNPAVSVRVTVRVGTLKFGTWFRPAELCQAEQTSTAPRNGVSARFVHDFEVGKVGVTPQVLGSSTRVRVHNHSDETKFVQAAGFLTGIGARIDTVNRSVFLPAHSGKVLDVLSWDGVYPADDMGAYASLRETVFVVGATHTNLVTLIIADRVTN